VFFFFCWNKLFAATKRRHRLIQKRSNIFSLVLKERRFSFAKKHFFFAKGDSASGTRTEVPKLIFNTKIKENGSLFWDAGLWIPDWWSTLKKKKPLSKLNTTEKKKKILSTFFLGRCNHLFNKQHFKNC